jgi:hypothetical protein
MNQEENMGSALRLAVLAALGGIYAAPALAADTPAAPPAPTSLLEAIQMGKPMTSFRLRYEHVDQDGIVPGVTPAENLDNANAWTLRSLIGWQTAPFKNFSIAAQLINVTRFNDDFYDGTDAVFGSVKVPYDRKKYATVADPDYTNFNQLYLDWTGLPDTKFRLGRQSVKLDNVRFIGNVEFRQVMQVFDGLAVENKSIKDVELYAAHFEGLTRINTMHLSDGHVDIAHATWKYTPTESLTGYGYFQAMPYNGFNPYTNDAHTTYGGTGFSDNSNQTYGLRADGSHKINDDWKALYTAEYAKQDNYRGGNDLIDAHYWRAGAGAGWKSWYLRLDRELLSSNDGLYGFQTPLATGHLFQGWGDSFLTTPKQGMEDTFLSFGGKVFDIQLSGEYHWFKSDDNFRTAGDSATHFTGKDYGKELDLSVAYSYGKNWLGKIEYFHYTNDDCYTTNGNCSSTSTTRSYLDKDNFLLTLQYTF